MQPGHIDSNSGSSAWSTNRAEGGLSGDGSSSSGSMSSETDSNLSISSTGKSSAGSDGSNGIMNRGASSRTSTGSETAGELSGGGRVLESSGGGSDEETVQLSTLMSLLASHAARLLPRCNYADLAQFAAAFAVVRGVEKARVCLCACAIVCVHVYLCVCACVLAPIRPRALVPMGMILPPFMEHSLTGSLAHLLFLSTDATPRNPHCPQHRLQISMYLLRLAMTLDWTGLRRMRML
eukprot:scaffold6529_cov20-Tisochrysis_lutea.AAC.1